MKVGYMTNCVLCGAPVSEEEWKEHLNNHLKNHFPGAFYRVSTVLLPDEPKKERPKKRPKPAPDPVEEESEEEVMDLLL